MARTRGLIMSNAILFGIIKYKSQMMLEVNLVYRSTKRYIYFQTLL